MDERLDRRWISDITKMRYQATRQPNQTDDEWLMNGLYPLKTWAWFDGARE